MGAGACRCATSWGRPLNGPNGALTLLIQGVVEAEMDLHLTEENACYLGVGHKDTLGFYVAESEGAHFWLRVLADLKERGVQDILIACVDGLPGFEESIQTIFP